MNSGLRRIGVITQYKSHSGLLRHIQRGWSFLRNEMNEFRDLLPAQQTSTRSTGTGARPMRSTRTSTSSAIRARRSTSVLGRGSRLQDGLLHHARRPCAGSGRGVTVCCIEVPPHRGRGERLRRDGRQCAAPHHRLRRKVPDPPTMPDKARHVAGEQHLRGLPPRSTSSACSMRTPATRIRATTSARTSSRARWPRARRWPTPSPCPPSPPALLRPLRRDVGTRTRTFGDNLDLASTTPCGTCTQ